MKTTSRVGGNESRSLRERGVTLAASMLSVAVLTSCAVIPSREIKTSNNLPEDWLAKGYAAAEKGDWNSAQSAFAQALRSDVSNGYVQNLNGLAYDQLSIKDGSQADFAAVAYDNARALAPGQYWAALMHGYLELRRNQPTRAIPHFARAALDEDAQWEASYGLATAAYYSGDLALAEIATRQSLRAAPNKPEVVRLAALVHAASGRVEARHAAARYASLGAASDDARLVARRVEHLLLLASDEASRSAVQVVPLQVESEAAASTEAPPEVPLPGANEEVPAADGASQISVDVTIILSSVLKNERRGLNLLDALSLTYSQDRSISRSRTEVSGSDPVVNSVRTITQNIGIPQLNYNLNIFNNSGQYYSVLARPSITAYLQQTSEFFAGRTVNVQVSGVNLGQLQPIDVGVGLKVTPESITGERTIFKVEASRSFLSQEEIGRFDQSLTTFKQAVTATADVAFGETLILSALSETVRDSTISQVPILGDIPILSAITRERETANREESLLVLVTPQRPTAVDLGLRGARPQEVERLLRFWSSSGEPTSGLDDVLRRIEKMPIFRNAEKADLYSKLPDEKQLVRRALDQTYQLAHRSLSSR